MTSKTTLDTKIQTPETIKELLSNSNAAVERALVVLYERQTADEQASQSTSHQNGMGFGAFDAEILSSFACQVNAKLGQHSDYLGRARKLGECLSAKQMELARKKVVRYAKQLALVANEKLGKESAKVEIETLKAEGVKVSKAQEETYMGVSVADLQAQRSALLAAVVGGEENPLVEVAIKVAHMVGEPVEYTIQDALMDSYEALQGARQTLAQERKLTTTYYNGRRTVDIAQERVEELERNHDKLIREGKGQTFSSDPEHRAFRDTNAKLKGWLGL